MVRKWRFLAVKQFNIQLTNQAYMDEEMIFLLQQLEEAFKDMTGCSLRESNRAAEYIRRNRKIEDFA